MREIKFRGLNAVTKKWVFGSLIRTTSRHKTESYEFTKSFINQIEEDDMESFYGNGFVKLSNSSCVVTDKSVGQYTGLKDKSGVEIYEGILSTEINVNHAWLNTIKTQGVGSQESPTCLVS